MYVDFTCMDLIGLVRTFKRNDFPKAFGWFGQVIFRLLRWQEITAGKELPFFSRAEVAKHNTAEESWLTMVFEVR